MVEAYAALGLEPAAGINAAKTTFRALVKQLHPDVTPPTPETLARLARIVAAMDVIKRAAPTCLEIEITARDAAAGVTRTLRAGGRSILVRIPAGTADGAVLPAIGESDVAVSIRLSADPAQTAAPAETSEVFADLDGFIHEFSRPSAHARFARWIRKAQSAA